MTRTIWPPRCAPTLRDDRVPPNPVESSLTSVDEWGVSKSFRLKLVEPSLTSVDERGVSKPFRLKLVEPTLRSVDERGVSKTIPVEAG